MNKGNLNKLVTNYPVELTEEEIENLSGTLAPVIAACGGGGGTGGKIYTGIGFVNVNNTTNQIGLTNEANTKLNQYIPTKVSDLSDSANYQTVAGMDEYLTTANAQTLYQTKDDMSAYLTSANASSTYQTIAGMDEYATKDWTNTNFISEQELAGSVVPVVENAGFAYKSYINDELNKKENKLTFAYDNDKISAINGSALAGQGGTTYSAGAGIAIVDEYISLSADYIQAITQVSGKQDKLEFTYDNSGSIIKINNSAIAGGAGGGSVSYTGRNGVEINGNYIELETAAKNAIDSVAGISTDVGTLKTASANWNEVSAKLDSSLASTTYQTKSDMSNYLTTSDAASTYQHIGNYATKSDINDMATQTWVGQQGFYTKASGDNDYAPKSVTATVNTLTGASAGWNEVSSKLGTAQYATDSATFLKQSDLDDYYQKTDTSSKDELSDEFAKYVTSSNVTTQDTDYVMTTTGWKVLTLPGGGMTQVIHDETLTGQGNDANSKLSVAWSALSGNTINSALSAGSATSALSAEDAESARYTKQLKDASKIIQIGDITALQNWASSNSSTWEGVTAKLGTAQYAEDSATFVTSSNDSISAAGEQYALTTTGWAKVSTPTIPDITANNGLSANGHTIGIDNTNLVADTQYAWTTTGWSDIGLSAYLPLSGGTVSGKTTISGSNFDNTLEVIRDGQTNNYAHIGLNNSRGLSFKAFDDNASTNVQFDLFPNNSNSALIQVQHNGSTVGNLIPAVTATTTAGLTNDGILHIILES